MEKITSLQEQLQNWIMTFGPKLVSALLVFIIGLFVINWIAKPENKNRVFRGLTSAAKLSRKNRNK